MSVPQIHTYHRNGARSLNSDPFTLGFQSMNWENVPILVSCLLQLGYFQLFLKTNFITNYSLYKSKSVTKYFELLKDKCFMGSTTSRLTQSKGPEPYVLSVRNLVLGPHFEFRVAQASHRTVFCLTVLSIPETSGIELLTRFQYNVPAADATNVSFVLLQCLPFHVVQL